MNELLSEHAITEVQLRFGRKPTVFSDTALRMVRIFAKGQESGMWRDAEQFMDYVDVARLDAVRAQLIRGLDYNLGETAIDWATALKRFMAARVSTFLQGANLDSELWQPYIRWARQLTPDDTVITFNWDRVLELIAEYGTRPADAKDNIPEKPAVGLTKDSFYRVGEGTRVLKLHGSVDWKRVGDICQTTTDPLFALDCVDEQIAIATPGPAKQAASNGFLKPLWDEAEGALSRAAAVVFLGYRFPPSDSQARESLLTALSTPPAPEQLRGFHTVLGPAVRDEHSARVEGLVRGMLDSRGWVENDGFAHNGPMYTFSQHPLYGQDFMSVFSRDRIVNPPMPEPVRGLNWPRSR